MTFDYMLDTNTVSTITSNRKPELRKKLRQLGSGSICVSAISYGETIFGLAKNPNATRLATMTHAFFTEVAVLAWTPDTADAYGQLRAEMTRNGKALAPLDMLIAAHAKSIDAVLVTSDQASGMSRDCASRTGPPDTRRRRDDGQEALLIAGYIAR